MQAGSSAASLTAAPPPLGAQRYTFLRRLAVGGMGELLLAHAWAPGGVRKLVAIKRVRPEYASDAEFVGMFLNEARLAATIDHPNVVRTYDLVEDTGQYCMVMEYLHGESLGQLLNCLVETEKRVPLSHIVTIFLGISAGLHCAHEGRGVDGRPLGIVHRDLSPGNVFITYDGGVKLLDFGIAKATSRTSITVGPARKGKASYMSPEQCVGAEVDRRSDIFSLGIVMWELCTGRRLFRGANEFGIMNQITTTDAPSPVGHVPDLPRPLVAILRRMLEREPGDRFQTALALHDALEAFASSEGLLPSATKLGRYLEKTCGLREFPSATPTDEFANTKEATLIAGGSQGNASKSRWVGLGFALIGGVTLGALAVNAASVTAPVDNAAPAAAVTPAPTAQSESMSASKQPAIEARARISPTAANVALPPVEPSPSPPPTVSQEAGAAAPPARQARGRKKKKSHTAARSTPAADKPRAGRQSRGVDGILPSG